MKKRNVALLLSYVNTFLTMFCGLFLSAFLVRQLGDTNYGVYQTMSSFANYLVLLEFGAGTVMSRNISACRTLIKSKLEIEKNVSTIWGITSFLAIVIILVAIVFYSLIERIYDSALTAEQIVLGKKIFLFITLYLVSSFFSQTINGVTLAFEDYTFKPICNILRTVLRTCILIMLIIQWKNALIIALVDAVLSFCFALFSYFYCKHTFKIQINLRCFDVGILKYSLPFCIAIFLQGFVNQINSNIGKFILGIKAGPEEVTLFSVGVYIYSIFSSLTTLPISMYMPQISRDVLSGLKGKDLTNQLVQPSRLCALIGGTVLFGFVAAGKPFIKIVYGEQYLEAWLIAITFMTPMLLNMTVGVTINVLDVLNKRLVRSLILTGTTLLNLFLSIIMIEYFGGIGSAISTAICVLIGQVIIMNIYYHFVIKIEIITLYKKAYKGILVYQIFGASIGYLISSYFSNSLLSFLISGGAYVVISFGGYLLFGKNEVENAFVQKFLNQKAFVRKL